MLNGTSAYEQEVAWNRSSTDAAGHSRKKPSGSHNYSEIMKKEIPLVHPMIDEREVEAASQVLRSRMLAQGAITSNFESAFAAYVGVNEAIAVSSGTAALDISLKSAGIKQGDEVITTAFSFIASTNAILYQRAKPIFADIQRDTFALSPEDVKEKVTDKTRAVVAVHLFGQPFDVAAIQEICTDHNLVLIEDCAQAHGAKFEGEKVGSFGIGCFSFYATKNMTTGEGGMVTTSDATIARSTRLLRDHGQSAKYVHSELGYNYRMTDVEAAVGIAQLEKLDTMNAQRISNARYLNRHISLEGATLPRAARGTTHVYHQYVMTLAPEQRDQCVEYVRARGVGCAIHYPLPIYRQPLYQRLGYSRESAACPVAEEVAQSVFSLPVHPALTRDDLAYVAQTVNDFGGR
ncbi:MAG: DegT/DnrJ/EryC1/StrS family aminotransferase [Halobacteriota archaeon]